MQPVKKALPNTSFHLHQDTTKSRKKSVGITRQILKILLENIMNQPYTTKYENYEMHILLEKDVLKIGIRRNIKYEY